MQDARDKPTVAKHQIRGSTLLLIGRVLALCINLAVQVLTVRYLSKTDFGAFAFAMSMVAIGANLCLFGLNRSVSRFVPIYHEQKDYARMGGTLVLVLANVLGLGAAIALFVGASQQVIRESVVSDPLSVTLLLTLIALAPVDAMDVVFQSMFAVLGNVRVVFFRRHLLGPMLKLLAVLGVIAFHRDVHTLALGYLAAGLLGMLLYALLLYQILRKEDILQHFRLRQLKVPVREIYGFSIPLFSSQFGFLFRSAMVVLLLEVLYNSTAVADFRAVLPFARLNLVVLESFTFLFTPIAARMFARREGEMINDLYWCSAIWVSVLTFPIFLVTVVFAKPLTVLMLGERYIGASAVMALLATGFFFDAALGFAVQTLRVYGRVRYIVLCDIAAILAALGLNLLLIPRYGAVGAAVATSTAMILQNVFYLVCMRRTTVIGRMDWRHVHVYASFGLAGAALIGLQVMLAPHFVVALLFVFAAWLVVIGLHRDILDAQHVFPELLRIPVLGRILSGPGEVAVP